MSTAQPVEPTPRKPLRLWPGVVAVLLQWLVRFGGPVVAPDAIAFAIIGGVLGGVAVVLWWLFFSRAPWSERLGAIVLMTVALFATSRIVDESIATGAMGMLFPILAIPGPEPRTRRVGSGHPSACGRASARCHGRGYLPRERSVDARQDRRVQRQLR